MKHTQGNPIPLPRFRHVSVTHPPYQICIDACQVPSRQRTLICAPATGPFLILPPSPPTQRPIPPVQHHSFFEMNAMDLNWCLTCNRYIDVDGGAPYCSPECYASDRPSMASSSYPSARRHAEHNAAFTSTESISELDDCDQCSSRFGNILDPNGSSRWIGKGDAGIHAWASDVPAGPPEAEPTMSLADLKPPSLILSSRRPLPPTLCMSRPTPAAAEPSLPIRTPLLPASPSSSSSRCPTDSAYTTPSSSFFLATPEDQTPILPHAQPSGLISAITARFRSWTVSNQTDGPSKTLTRQRADSAACANLQRTLPAGVLQDDAPLYSESKESYRASWTSLFHTEKLADGTSISGSWQAIIADEHSALRMRGRKPSRLVS